MSLPHRTSPPDDCRRLAADLDRLEAGAASTPALLGDMSAHVARCAPCAARHGRRLRTLEAFCCLRGRAVPSGLLDRVADAVEARAPAVPVGGGMSLAFLDGPRSLRLWRTTAAAAGLLLAVGAGLVATGRLGAGRTPPTPVPLNDARGALLEDLDVATSRRAWAEGAVQPASWPAHRAGQRFFWFAPVPNGRSPEAPAAPRWD